MDGMMLALLRTRTRAQHERVERTMDLSSRLETPARYAALLSRLHAFYAPLERRLLAAAAHLEGAGVDLAARRKTSLLEQDLRVLGAAPPPEACEAAATDLPRIGCAAAAFGCLYVLEGATLGGRVIRRELSARLGLAEHDGGSFFAGYGERTRAMWMSFCERLEAFAALRADQADAMCDAAAETFERYDAWLSGDAGPPGGSEC